MKKNSKGFTLVELLAVIVVLSIIMAVAGTAALKIRKNANIEEAKKLEQTLEELGPNLFSYEMSRSSSSFYNAYKTLSIDEDITISSSDLYNAGYLKSPKIDNPSGGEVCNGFMSVKKTSSGPEFIGKICCPGLYETDNASQSDPTPTPPGNCPGVCCDYNKGPSGYFD